MVCLFLFWCFVLWSGFVVVVGWFVVYGWVIWDMLWWIEWCDFLLNVDVNDYIELFLFFDFVGIGNWIGEVGMLFIVFVIFVVVVYWVC